MRNRHTPGPWRLCPTNSGIMIGGGVPGYIAQVRHCRGDQDPEADARLIAASPDLLEALRDLLGTCGAFSPKGKAAIDAARATIAKVEGRQS